MSSSGRRHQIKRLDKDLVSKIRSSVVITSIAQVLSELVQNSVDAGATSITARVDTLTWAVVVSDNGVGISFEDLHEVGTRYSTSKCTFDSDLRAPLATYGFRGEAVGSIADVSLFELVSRCHESSQAFRKVLHGGKFVSLGPVSSFTSPGTTASAQNIFFNMPVKRKCLDPNSEIDRCRQEITNIALVNPSVSFSLYEANRSQPLLQFPRCGSSLSRFRLVYGNKKAEWLSEVSVGVENNSLSLSGYLSHPLGGHHNKDLQLLYVNRHFVKNTPIHKTINNLYSQSSEGEGFAVFLLKIVCAAEAYDITYSPQKTSVEFRDWDSLLALTTHIVLDLFKELGSGRLVSRAAPVLHSEDPQGKTEGGGGDKWGKGERKENGVGSSCFQATSLSATNALSHENKRVAFPNSLSRRENVPFLPPQQRILELMEKPIAKGFGSGLFTSDFTLTKEMLKSVQVINQMDQKFILCKMGDLLLLVDQHAADERVRFEMLEDQIFGECGQKRHLQVEFLSQSIAVDTNEHERYLLERFRACLEYWGWSFSSFSSLQPNISLFSVPKVLDVILDHQDFLKEFISELEESGGSRYLRPKSITKILQSKSCRGAIMFGETLDLQQCEELMKNLATCRAPFTCAHGRPSVHPLLDLEVLMKSKYPQHVKKAV